MAGYQTLRMLRLMKQYPASVITNLWRSHWSNLLHLQTLYRCITVRDAVQAFTYCLLLLSAILCSDFLKQTAHQLTYHGLCRLNATITDHQLCAFFRNNHFSTLYKHQVFSCLCVFVCVYISVGTRGETIWVLHIVFECIAILQYFIGFW